MKYFLYIGCEASLWQENISKFKSNKFKNILIAEKSGYSEHRKNIFEKIIFFPEDLDNNNYEFIDQKTNQSLLNLYNNNIYNYNDCLSRLLINYKHSNYNYRSNFILNLIYFLFNLIKKYKFSKIIAASPPHRLYDIILRDISKLEKIDFYYPEYSYFGDHGLFLNFTQDKNYLNFKNLKNDKVSKSVALSVKEILNKKSNVKINLKLNNLNIVFKFINLFKKICLSINY